MTAQEWLKEYEKIKTAWPKQMTELEEGASSLIRAQQAEITRLTAECQKWQEWHDCEYRERKKYRQDANYFSGEIDRLTAKIAELKAADGLYTDAETGPEYSFAHQKFQEAVKELFKELERGNDDRN